MPYTYEVGKGDRADQPSTHNRVMSYIESDSSKDSEALDSIAALLSGAEWNIDTLMSISELVTQTGREIKDLQE